MLSQPRSEVARYRCLYRTKVLAVWTNEYDRDDLLLDALRIAREDVHCIVKYVGL